MRLRYFMMSVLMMGVTAVGFTSCSDNDDETPAPVVDEKEDLTFENGLQRVKIGTENRVPVPIASGNGEYNAFSLTPEIADIVKDDNGIFIEGYRNGTASIVVSDASGMYRQLQVKVYTTDVLKLSHEQYHFKVPKGFSTSSKECAVTLGNGEYTVESDNADVKVSIDSDMGAITMTAKSAENPYTAIVTVTDADGLSASINVSVEASLEPFTQFDLDELLRQNTILIDYNGKHTPTFDYMTKRMVSRTENGLTYTGYEYKSTYMHYSHLLIYPEGTPVGVEVDGSIEMVGSRPSNDTGKIKILADNDNLFVGVFYKVDKEAGKIDRGYVVWPK